MGMRHEVDWATGLLLHISAPTTYLGTALAFLDGGCRSMVLLGWDVYTWI